LALKPGLAFADSKISDFGGAYTVTINNVSIPVIFKAAHNKEWGGFKLIGPKNSRIESYSFRNSRFEYRSYRAYPSYNGIGKVQIQKGLISYQTDLEGGSFLSHGIKGSIKKVPGGLKLVEYVFSDGSDPSISVYFFKRQ
jgi:hypothetical protein